MKREMSDRMRRASTGFSKLYPSDRKVSIGRSGLICVLNVSPK